MHRVSAVLPVGETCIAAVQLSAGPIIPIGSMRLRVPLRPRVLVATDRSLFLYTASWFSVCKPKELITALEPRDIAVPHRQSLEWETTVDIRGETHWANFASREELREVTEASAALEQRLERLPMARDQTA